MADRHLNCSVCHLRIRSKVYRMHFGTPLWNAIVFEHPRDEFMENSPICQACYRRYRGLLPPQQHQVEPDLEEPEVVHETVNVNRVPSFESGCCVCGAPGRSRITALVRAQCWSRHRIFIPIGNRHCAHHLTIDGVFNEESVQAIFNRSVNTDVHSTELAEYLDNCLINSFAMPTPAEVQPARISVLQLDSDCLCYTGLHLETFERFCDGINIPSMAPNTKVTALALLLAKLRMGNSQNQLAHFFGLSQPTVSNYIKQASEAVDEQFVPLFLGYRHITREEYIQRHMNTMTRILHEVAPGSASALLDSTYFEVEKSSNFRVQKVTYSTQKHYNLVKFMFVVAPDGYILNIFGPTGSDSAHNDASILNRMLEDQNGLRTFFHEGDLFIVDRAFRDSQQPCDELGIRIRMPAMLNGRARLSREEADSSRMVTKVRWTIESVNGRIKNVCGMFRHPIPSKSINSIGKYLRITCALLNAYFRPIYPDQPEQLAIARYIVDRSLQYTDFHDQILAFGLDSFSNQWRLSNINDIHDFPRFSEQDLRDITVGIYQINNANRYTAYHLERFNSVPENLENYHVYAHQEFQGIILARIPSRHVQAKWYNAIIAYIPGQHGPNGVIGYFCSCHIGLRMVGMCSHTASILWLLSFAVPNDAYRIPAHHIADDLINLRI